MVITYLELITQTMLKEVVCAQKRLARKLANPKTSSKTCWSVLKTFYNNRQKFPLIPPLVINNNLELDFKRKADHFNNFFAAKCTPLKMTVFYLPY